MTHLSLRRIIIAVMFVCLAPWTLPAAHSDELATLTAINGGINHRFGFAVAISGDTIVVGAPSANAGKGAAYVFIKPAGPWTTTQTPTAILTDNSLSGSADFGFAVAISGDTIVVGAPGAKVGNHINQGQAAVFVKPGAGWSSTASPTARLADTGGASNDRFGFAVAIDGDEVVIGTPDAKKRKGEVHVFKKPASGWITSETPTATLISDDSAANDRFGFTVAISGGTVVTGAYAHKIGAKTSQGAAYIFVRPGGTWVSTDTPTAKLRASDGEETDQFGNAVAIDGATIVVGAWLKDIGSKSDQGAAYLFVKPGADWTSMSESAILRASDGRNSDSLGIWVAIDGDKVVAGASLDDAGTNRNEGSVYIFAKPLTGWTSMTETAKLTATAGRAGDAFGFATAISNNIMVVGVPNDDVGSNTQQGSASVFSTAGLAPVVGASVLPSAEVGALYNASIAISGGTPPFVVSDNNSLPPGLNVNNNGIISGTPANDAKSGSVTFVITDQNNASASKTVNLKIVKPVTVATKKLAQGKVGKSYKAPLKAKAGKGPYTWSVTAGALPAGLSINNDIDAITGVPTTAAGSPFNVTIKVTDALGGVATKALSISIDP
jgi:hypothetical protein